MSFDPHSVSDQAHVPPVTTTQPAAIAEASTSAENQAAATPVYQAARANSGRGLPATVVAQTLTQSNSQRQRALQARPSGSALSERRGLPPLTLATPEPLQDASASPASSYHSANSAVSSPHSTGSDAPASPTSSQYLTPSEVSSYHSFSTDGASTHGSEPSSPGSSHGSAPPSPTASTASTGSFHDAVEEQPFQVAARKKLIDLLVEKLLPAIEPALRQPVIEQGKQGLANTGANAVLSKTELAVQDIVWKDFRSLWDAIYKSLTSYLGDKDGVAIRIRGLYTQLEDQLRQADVQNIENASEQKAAIERVVQALSGQVSTIARDPQVIRTVTAFTQAGLQENAEKDQDKKIEAQVGKHQGKEEGADLDPVNDLAATQTTINDTLAFVNRAVTGTLTEAEFSELAEGYLAESKKFITDEIKSVIQKELTASAQRHTTAGVWGRARLNPKYWTGGDTRRANRQPFKNVAQADINALYANLNANPAPANDAAAPANDEAAPAEAAAPAQTLPAVKEDAAKPQGTAYKKSLYKAALSDSQRDKTRKTYTNELIKTSASTVAGKLYDQNSEIIVSDDILNRALLAFYNGLMPGGGGLKGEYRKKARAIGERVQEAEKRRLIQEILARAQRIDDAYINNLPEAATLDAAGRQALRQSKVDEQLKTALGMSLLLKEQLKDSFGEEMSSYQGRAHEAKVVAAKEALKGFKSSKYTDKRHQLKAATLQGATNLVNGQFVAPQPAPAQEEEQEQAPAEAQEQEQVEAAVPAPAQEQAPVAAPAQEPEAQEAAAQEPAPVAAQEQARPELNLHPELNAADLQKAKSDALDATLEAKTLNAFFDKVSALMQPSLQLVGDTLQLKVNGKIPLVIDGGFASVNIGIKLKAIKLPSYTRVSPEITVGMTGSVLGALDLTGAIGGSLAGSGASVREAFSMISYAMYRRAKNSKIVPSSMVDSLWSMGGASQQDGETVGAAKKREHSEWAGSLEEKMTHKWAGESGVTGSFKATTNLGVNSINPALDPHKLASVGGELELKGFWGERYRKRSKKATTITREDLKRLTVALSGSAGAALGGSFNGELNWEWTNNKLSSIDGTVIVGATIDFGKLYSQGTKDVGAKISQSILAALMTGAVPAIKNLGTRADAQLRAQKQLTEPEADLAAAPDAANPVAAAAPAAAAEVGAALAARVAPPVPVPADNGPAIEMANLAPNPAPAAAVAPADAAVGDADAAAAAPAPAAEETQAQKFERDLRKAGNTAENTGLKHYGQALGKDTDWAGMGKNYASAAVGAGVGVTGDLAKTIGHAGVYGKDVTAKYPGVGPDNPGIHAGASPTLPWDNKLAINLMFLIGKNIIKEPRRWEVDMIASTDKTTAFNAYFVSGESKKSETFYYKKLKA